MASWQLVRPRCSKDSTSHSFSSKNIQLQKHQTTSNVMPEIETAVNRFNNSIANQQNHLSNGSAYVAQTYQEKSRNQNAAFKTTGSVNGPSSTKNNKNLTLQGTVEMGSSKFKNSTNGIPVVVTADPLSQNTIQAKRKQPGQSIGTNKFSQTIVAGGLSSTNNANLYSMIY